MKDTFYFTHDYNTRTDKKIKSLVRKHGMLGYGLYWAIIEDLYQNSNNIPIDYDQLVYDFRVEEHVIKSIVEDFGLFDISDGYIQSFSVEKRLNERSKKSKIASENAKARWGKSDDRKIADEAIFYVIKIYNASEEFVKCGTTTESISRRYSGKLNGYKYETILSLEMSNVNALKLEKEINKEFESYTPKNKFHGYLECYSSILAEQIKNFAMHLHNNGNAIKESKESKVDKGNEINKRILSEVNPSDVPLEDSEYFEIAKGMHAYIKKNIQDAGGSTSTIDKAKYEIWVRPIRLMMSRDKITKEQIRKVATFALKDQFWKKNILSTQKFREQFDRLTLDSHGDKTGQRKPANERYSEEYIQKIHDDIAKATGG